MIVIGKRYGIDRDNEKSITLGKGSFGVVIQVRDTILHHDVAMKRMPSVYESFDDTKRVLRELRLLRLMRHESVLGILDAFIEEDEKDTIYFTTPQFDSDLSIATKKVEVYKKIASPAILISIMRQVLQGINYLHEMGVIHRDIKPANILIDFNSIRIKICDFGLARMLPLRSPTSKGNQNPLTEYVNTRWYRAPEVTLSNGQYGCEQDVWAAACTFIDLIFRQPLFPGKSCLKQLSLIIDMLGTPSKPDELAFTMTVPAMRYLCSLPSTKGTGIASFLKPRWNTLIIQFSVSFQDYFLVLITEMLAFDTKHRISAAAALTSTLFQPFFSNSNFYPVDAVPIPEQEEVKQPPIDMRDIERCSVALYPNNLRHLLRQEINLIHTTFLACSSSLTKKTMLSSIPFPTPPQTSLSRHRQDRPNTSRSCNNIAQLDDIMEVSETEESSSASPTEPKRSQSLTNVETAASSSSSSLTLTDMELALAAAYQAEIERKIPRPENGTERDDSSVPKNRRRSKNSECSPSRTNILDSFLGIASISPLKQNAERVPEEDNELNKCESHSQSNSQKVEKIRAPLVWTISDGKKHPHNPATTAATSDKIYPDKIPTRKKRPIADFFATVTSVVLMRGSSFRTDSSSGKSTTIDSVKIVSAKSEKNDDDKKNDTNDLNYDKIYDKNDDKTDTCEGEFKSGDSLDIPRAGSSKGSGTFFRF